MAPDSKTPTEPSPNSGAGSWSTIAGIRLFGLIARNSGVNCSPLEMLTGIIRYAAPSSSSRMATFQPFGVGQ